MGEVKKVTQEVNLRISSLTIRVTESGVRVGLECSWSDSTDNITNPDT